ncbi:UNVERIFIED_CONTAM: hypothetical protein HDU68_010062 [Siphonaria sp. JEL0065]|nr:hypothetical protein HDU68_010062 [Siphonaria sp. JEL0065]
MRVNSFAENDYVLVVFSSGSRHKPSIMWTLKAYQHLERKFRKNLKRLYVVHPSSWFKLVMQVFGPVISPKFKSKVEWVHNIKELSQFIPLSQVRVPKLIQEIDKSRILIEPKDPTASNNAGIISSLTSWAISLTGLNSVLPASPTTTNQFGVPLEQLMGPKGEKGLPRIVEDCIGFILLHGLETEGLFRISPSLQSVNQVREKYNSNEISIDFDEYGGVHTACGLLKSFFRDLPTPIFEASMYDTIRMIQQFSSSSTPTQKAFTKTALLPILPVPTYLLLRSLFHLLHTIHSCQQKTLMHSGNLAIVWAPNFVKSVNPMVDLGMCAVGTSGGGIGTLVKICIEEWDDMFGDVVSNGADGDDYLPGFRESNAGREGAERFSFDQDGDVVEPLPEAPPTITGRDSGGVPAAERRQCRGGNGGVGERPVSAAVYEAKEKDDESLDDFPTNFGIGRRESKSSDYLSQPRHSESAVANPVSANGGKSVASGVVSGSLPAPIARGRPRGSARSNSMNRHTIVAAEESTIAMFGVGLSHTTLGTAALRQSGEDGLFRNPSPRGSRIEPITSEDK